MHVHGGVHIIAFQGHAFNLDLLHMLGWTSTQPAINEIFRSRYLVSNLFSKSLCRHLVLMWKALYSCLISAQNVPRLELML
jgi:hypothetical protein